MSFKEVKELRLSGQLEKAYELAMQDYSNNKNDIWNTRSLAWVLYSMIKKGIKEEKYDDVTKKYEEFESLNIPSSEEMIIENFNRFKFSKYSEYPEFLSLSKKGNHLEAFDKLFSVSNQINEDDYTIFCNKLLWEIYHFIKKSNLTRQTNISASFVSKESNITEAYSITEDVFNKNVLLKLQSLEPFYKPQKELINKLIPILLMKVQKEYKKLSLFDFYKWFKPLECIKSEDFIEEEFKGKKLPSICERILLSYSKTIIENDLTNEIEEFIELLDTYIVKYPNYQYLPYYKAKLLLFQGDKEKSKKIFLPFARKRRNEFWIWDLMSDLYDNTSTEYIACLCRAIDVGFKEEMLVNVRAKLLDVLVINKQFDEAKTELNRIITVRKKNEWKISEKMLTFQKTDWYTNANDLGKNSVLYKSNLSLANEILYNEIEEEIAVVDWVNHKKGMLNFIINNNRSGFLHYKGLVSDISIGDHIKARIEGVGVNTRYNVFTIHKIEKEERKGLYEAFQGEIRIRDDNNFGFVDDIFVSQDLINKNMIKDNNIISGFKILSFNKKRNQFSWRCARIK